MKFFNCDCGPSGSSQYRPPCVATIDSDAYLTLTVIPKGRLLVVSPGTTAQQFMKPAMVGETAVPGFVFDKGDGLGAYCEPQPKITLPTLNPPVSGVFPPTGNWQYILTATGSADAPWTFIAAPSTGTFIVQAKNGTFSLVDAGQIPGIDQIGAAAGFALKGSLLCTVLVGSAYVVQKLKVVDRRVVVGNVDVDGNAGYTPLSGGDYLEHPKAKLGEFLSRTFVTLEADNDTPITNGLELALAFGVGAIVDGFRVQYSPTAKRFFQAPAHTIASVVVPTNTGLVTVPSAYALIPGGHGAGVTHSYNYGNVRLDFSAGLANAAGDTLSFGIYRDGALLQEYDNDNNNTLTVSYIDTTVTPGSHTYDIRWKRTSGTDQVNMRNSMFLIQTLQP